MATGRTTQFIDDAKLALSGKKTEEAVMSLPPGFIVGFRLRTSDGQMFVGKGVMNCRGKACYHKTEDVINGEDYVQKNYIFKGMTYYVYMNADKQMKIDTLAEVWDDENFGYYHPALYQYRFLGQFYYELDGTYTKIINQDPVVGTDINAEDVSSLLVKTLLAQVTDYIVVGLDPDGTPAEDDVACFIYEDMIQIKKYIGATWVVRQQFGDTTIIGHDIDVGAKMTIGAELFIGFTSFSGTSTLDLPGEGDTVHYINGTTDQYQEYTNGGWVVTANGIKIGGVVAGIFLNMIACGGVYHPANPPASSEQLPHPNFRVFNFENNYEDQNGLDDWATKTNLAFDTTVKKFGSYSLFATAGNVGTLAALALGVVGESQSIGVYFYFEITGGEGEGEIAFELFSFFNANNIFRMYIVKQASSNNGRLRLEVTKTGTTTTINDTVDLTQSSQIYVGFAYSETDNIIRLVRNNSITSSAALSGSWGSGTMFFQFNPRNAWVSGATTISVYFDEALFYYDKYLDPNLLAQHYTHNVAWSTTYSKADIAIIPDTDGRVYSPVGFLNPVAKYTYQVAQNTDGGASVAGSYQTRAINTESYDTIGITLSSNQLTVPAGVYMVHGEQTFFGANHRILTRLYNNTTSAELLRSCPEYGNAAETAHPAIMGRITLTASSVLIYQYWVGTAVATNGLGQSTNFDGVEVYAQLLLTRVG